MFGYQKQKIKIETVSLTNLETWNFDKCHTNALFSGPGYNLVSHIANNCHIFLAFSNLGQFLSLCLA